MKTIAFQPVGLNQSDQPGDVTLGPQQFAVLIIDQRHRGTLHVEVLGKFDVDLITFPFCKRIKEITFAAQQTKRGLIETHAVADQRNHAIGQRKHQHYACGGQQKTQAQ